RRQSHAPGHQQSVLVLREQHPRPMGELQKSCLHLENYTPGGPASVAISCEKFLMGKTGGRIAFWIVGGLAALLLIAALAAWLYLKGVWRPAYPDIQSFPVRGIDVSHH